MFLRIHRALPCAIEYALSGLFRGGNEWLSSHLSPSHPLTLSLLELVRVVVHRYRHRSVGVEYEGGIQGLLLSVGAAGRYDRCAGTACDEVGGFADGQVGQVERGGACQGRVDATQRAGDVAFEVVRAVYDVGGVLEAQACEGQVAGSGIGARPVRGVESAVSSDVDGSVLWQTSGGAIHQPVHVKRVVVGGGGNGFAFLQGGIAGYVAVVEVGFDDLSHIDGGHGKSGSFGSNGIFNYFSGFGGAQQGDDFFAGFAAGNETDQGSKQEDRGDFLNVFHNS